VTSSPTSEAPLSPHWRSHAVVLALGTFAVATDMFVIAGLLPAVADSLQVSVAAAGQLVTVFSFSYALLAPVLATVTTTWSRRSVLITALAVFSTGNVLTALAPTYELVLASRIIAAAGTALYTATAPVTAASLAGPARRGRAIALVILGSTSALALGAPLGTAIGGVWGWRATMWFVTALALVVVPVLTVKLPDGGAGADGSLRQRLTPLKNRRVLAVLACTATAFVGLYAPYTYLSAVFEPIVSDDGNRLALLLLVYGVAGTVGNLTAGFLADRWGPRRVVTTATLALACVFVLLPAMRGSFLAAVPAVATAAVFSFAVNTPQQHRIIALVPHAQSVAASLHQSVMYLATSLAGIVGGIELELAGAAALPPLAAVLLVIAAGLSWATRSQPPTASPTGEEPHQARATARR